MENKWKTKWNFTVLFGLDDCEDKNNLRYSVKGRIHLVSFDDDLLASDTKTVKKKLIKIILLSFPGSMADI